MRLVMIRDLVDGRIVKGGVRVTWNQPRVSRRSNPSQKREKEGGVGEGVGKKTLGKPCSGNEELINREETYPTNGGIWCKKKAHLIPGSSARV